MPECAPVSTHPGQEGLREAGSGAKTGLEEPHGQRSPVTCLALDAKRALCSPSLGEVLGKPLKRVAPCLHRRLLGVYLRARVVEKRVTCTRIDAQVMCDTR